MKVLSATKLKNGFKKLLRLAAPLAGLRLLTKAQTVAYLAPSERACQPEAVVELPAVHDATDDTKLVFARKAVTLQASHAWYCQPAPQAASLLPNGSLRVGSRVLCPDYHLDTILRDSWRPAKRVVYETGTLVAPFSHYQDPLHFWGYYDYLFLVAAKLCRMLHAMPEVASSKAVVAYPLLGTTYEQEFLAIMGFQAERVLDSRKYDIRFGACLLGDNRAWFYPSLEDVQLLRRYLLPPRPAPTKRVRFYISRAGRRRITNEEELIAMLMKYDFTVLEDTPRSLAEQVTLYQQAEFIIGPHGAAFANIIFCQPGTQLYELFPTDYAPDYFLYLAQLGGLRYSASLQQSVAGQSASVFDTDIWVAVPAVEHSLRKLLAKPVYSPA